MKRTIVFRAKTRALNRWMYGALMQNGKEWGLICQDEDDANFGIMYYVDEDTVGQFTELYDSNGKPIYEGDIVEQYGESPVKPLKRLEEKDKKRKLNYRYFTGREWGERENYHLCIDSSRVGIERAADLIIMAAEVVGNIYDDEELVKEHNL